MRNVFKHDERLILLLVSIVSGSFSFISSFTIICMILKSKKKLTVPYRRFIFGLCAYDIFFSLAFIISWPSLPSSEGVWGTIGTRQTCEAQGFILFFGIVGTPLYNLSLSIFYVCTVVFSLKPSVFRKKVEPFLHAIPILWSFTGATYLLANQYFNPGPEYLVCWIEAYPPLCDHIDKIECLRGENAKQIRWILSGAPIIIIFIMIVILMLIICWRVIQQEKRAKKYRFDIHQPIEKSESIKRKAEDNACSPLRMSKMIHQNNQRHDHRSSTMVQMSKKSKAAMTQALLYILAFIITWILPFISVMFARRGKRIPFVLRVLSLILNASQGCINMLVYTRASIINLRTQYPEYSWLKAFITVVKSGGDNDGKLQQVRRQKRTYRERRSIKSQRSNSVD